MNGYGGRTKAAERERYEELKRMVANERQRQTNLVCEHKNIRRLCQKCASTA